MSGRPGLDVSPSDLQIVHDILRRHVPDREVWAFGSRATGKAKPYSDLDLVVIGDTPLGLAVSAALVEEFSESDLPFKVDIVDWATASAAFREIIRSDRITVQRCAEYLNLFAARPPAVEASGGSCGDAEMPLPSMTPIPATGVKRGLSNVRDIIHFGGGLRGYRVGPKWAVGPIRSATNLTLSTGMSENELPLFTNAVGLQLFGADEITDADPHFHHRCWRPLFGPPPLSFAPADTWAMVATSAYASGDGEYAALARNISVSMRAADLQLRNISDEYHRQLVAAIRRGRGVGARFTNVSLIELHLACHSHLSEMGSARDYLAQAAARRVGAPSKIDALNRLLDWLKKSANSEANADPLVMALVSANTASTDPWLAAIGNYRNQFLHNQPLATDDAARFMLLRELNTQIGTLNIIELNMRLAEGSTDECEVLTRFIDLHARFSRLAAFAATLAKYPPQPLKIVITD